MSPNKAGLATLAVLFLSVVNCDVVKFGNKTESLWRTVGELTGLLLHKCMQNAFDGPEEQLLVIFERCLKRRSLAALDRSLKSDVIKLTNGIELVRYREDSDAHRTREVAFFEKIRQSDGNGTDWKQQILRRVAHFFDTHTLKIRLNSYADLNNFITVEARGKRKQNMLMSLLMFGVAAVGLIAIPMGFQFLAVLGGKALLLSKMALILTAIQGLKKIATSNLHYGLYTTTPQHQQIHEPWNYNRQWPYEAESHDVLTSQSNYYQAPEQQSDFFHPLYPRVDPFRDMT